MKNYITVAALLAAGAAFVNADVTTVTFSAQNSPGDTSAQDWNVSETNGYYVGTSLDSSDWFSDFTWGAMTGASQIINQGQHPLKNGTIVPYASSMPTEYGITFTLTAAQDLVVSSVTFSFVGSFNGGSFDNAASSVSTDSSIKLSSDDSELASTTTTIEGTGLNEGVTSGTLPEANIVELSFDPITVSAGDSISFTLDVAQNTVNTGLKSIAFSTSAVPEPSAFGLLAGLGALALVASRRRRK